MGITRIGITDGSPLVVTSVTATNTVLGAFSSGAALSSSYAYNSAGTVTNAAGTVGSYNTALLHQITSNNANVALGYRANNMVDQNGFNATSVLAATGFFSDPRATGATGTVSGIVGFYSNPQNTGAGTVTTAKGFEVGGITNSGGGSVGTAVGFGCRNFAGGTTAYAAQLSLASGSGRWNLYADGTAVNYIAGNLQLGSATPTAGAEKLQVTGTASISGNTAVSGDLSVDVAGKGLKIKEGSNAKMGTATMVAGTVTVSTTAVTATSRIFLSIQSLGTVTVPTSVGVTARTAGTSFVITSANVVDTSVIAWNLIEPA